MSMTITLVNSGPGPCLLDGYPKLRFVAVTDAAVPFRQAYPASTSERFLQAVCRLRLVQ
jgi:hypothetical protein